MSRRWTEGRARPEMDPAREEFYSQVTPRGQTNARPMKPGRREDRVFVPHAAKDSGCHSQHVGLFPDRYL